MKSIKPEKKESTISQIIGYVMLAAVVLAFAFCVYFFWSVSQLGKPQHSQAKNKIELDKSVSDVNLAGTLVNDESSDNGCNSEAAGFAWGVTVCSVSRQQLLQNSGNICVDFDAMYARLSAAGYSYNTGGELPDTLATIKNSDGFLAQYGESKKDCDVIDYALQDSKLAPSVSFIQFTKRNNQEYPYYDAVCQIGTKTQPYNLDPYTRFRSQQPFDRQSVHGCVFQYFNQ